MWWCKDCGHGDELFIIRADAKEGIYYVCPNCYSKNVKMEELYVAEEEEEPKN